jgi:hypothetical protein
VSILFSQVLPTSGFHSLPIRVETENLLLKGLPRFLDCLVSGLDKVKDNPEMETKWKDLIIRVSRAAA